MKTCPECKSEFWREADNGQQYHCESVSCPDGSFIESWYCLRRQVRQQKAEKQELVAACQLFLKIWGTAGPQSSAQWEKFDVVLSAIECVLAKAEQEKP